eukprot:GSA25T00022828001.1
MAGTGLVHDAKTATELIVNIVRCVCFALRVVKHFKKDLPYLLKHSYWVEPGAGSVSMWDKMKAEGKLGFLRKLKLKVGMHFGPAYAGFLAQDCTFDLWGAHVNLAARMEGKCEEGRVLLSEATHARVAPYFDCEETESSQRGCVRMRNPHCESLLQDFLRDGFFSNATTPAATPDEVDGNGTVVSSTQMKTVNS